MRHGSLFSGIGGFDLAAQWMGWQNVWQCEIDPYCRTILRRRFPEAKLYGDIRGMRNAERVDIITGGFPCQPFSVAGKMRGEKDERFLWPEMLRVIAEVRPRWVVGENVYGLFAIDSGGVFERVCRELEGVGYQVQPVCIPACAVGAPHRRDRWWFIAADTASVGCKCRRDHRSAGQDSADQEWHDAEGERERQQRLNRSCADNTTHADTAYTGLQSVNDRQRKTPIWGGNPAADWREVAAGLCRAGDGLPAWVDGRQLSAAGHRVARIRALGNAIVPQVAYYIFAAIAAAETSAETSAATSTEATS